MLTKLFLKKYMNEKFQFWRTEVKRKRLLFIVSVLTNLLLFILLHHFLGFYFLTNDDKCITDILTGTFSQGPEAHTVYVNYLPSLILAGLYRLTSSVPWYGGSLILLEWIAYTCINYCFLTTANNLTGIVIRQGIYLCVFISSLYSLVNVQYTMVAALLAATGYFYLLTRRKEPKAIFIFFLLELTALLLRSHAMLMIQPLGLGCLVGCLWVWKSDPEGKWELKILRDIGVSLLLCLVIAGLGDIIGYSGKDWKEYKEYNAERTLLFDFYGTPEPEQIESLLEKHQVSELDYNAFRQYIILEDTIPLQFLQELSAYQQEHTDNKISIFDSAQTGWKALLDNGYQKYNKITLAAYLFLLLVILASRKWIVLLPSAMIMGARTAIWTYLIWKGRLPEWVSVPLLLCETLLLLALALEACQSMKKQDWFILLAGAGAVLFLVQSGKSFRQQFPMLRKEHNGQQIFMEGLRELQDYCNQQPDYHYLTEADSMMYFRGSALETELYQQPNYLVSGNWYSYSPVMKEKIASYVKEGNYENLYAITYQWEEGRPEWMIPYLNAVHRGTFEIVDEITASNGGIYLVYQLKPIINQ